MQAVSHKMGGGNAVERVRQPVLYLSARYHFKAGLKEPGPVQKIFGVDNPVYRCRKQQVDSHESFMTLP